MKFVRGLLDRIVLIAALVAFGCAPSFIAQYQQRVGGRLDQAERDLAPFQDIANRSFNGSIDALIRYHVSSADRTFHDEGRAIQQMVDAIAYLRGVLKGLDTDLFHQAAYLVLHPDSQTLAETWAAFRPGITLTTETAVFALVGGGIVWLLFIGLFAVLGARPGTPTPQLSRRDHLNVDLENLPRSAPRPGHDGLKRP